MVATSNKTALTDKPIHRCPSRTRMLDEALAHAGASSFCHRRRFLRRWRRHAGPASTPQTAPLRPLPIYFSRGVARPGGPHEWPASRPSRGGRCVSPQSRLHCGPGDFRSFRLLHIAARLTHGDRSVSGCWRKLLARLALAAAAWMLYNHELSLYHMFRVYRSSTSPSRQICTFAVPLDKP